MYLCIITEWLCVVIAGSKEEMDKLEAMFLEGMYNPLQSLESDSPPPIVQPQSSGGMYMYKCTHFLTISVLIDGTCNPRSR